MSKLGIHKYFQVGDIVKNPSVWGDKQLFIIYRMGGNDYYPELVVHFYGKPRTPKYKCNFGVGDTILVNSLNRPFRKVKKNMLLRLVKKGHFEATREFLIRTHNK